MTVENRLSPKRRKWPAFVIATFLIVLPLAGLCLYLIRWAAAPVEQTITADRRPAAIEPQYQTVSTHISRFTLPAGFRVATAADPAKMALTHIQAYETHGGGRQAGVTTNIQPAEGIAGVADYHLRRTSPGRYQTYTAADMPSGSIAFHGLSATDPEYILFLTDGRHYAAISVSGTGSPEALRSLFSQIYTSWHWL